MSDIQRNLTEYLRNAGITQSRIAELLGVSNACISRKMNLKRQFSIDEFATICEFIGVPMDSFRCEK